VENERFIFSQLLLLKVIVLLFTRCATRNASRYFKSPLAMGLDDFL